MPELQELALVCPGDRAVAHLLHDIRAPALQQLIILFNSLVQGLHVPSVYAYEITERFPVLRRIILVTHEEPLVFEMQDVIGWCKRGLTVEVSSKDESLRRIYTMESISRHLEEGV